jgi:hypothetical protein
MNARSADAERMRISAVHAPPDRNLLEVVDEEFRLFVNVARLALAQTRRRWRTASSNLRQRRLRDAPTADAEQQSS